MWPRLTRAAATATPRIARGRGEATTLRQPRPAPSAIFQPSFSSSAAALSREKKGPIGLVGARKAGSAASTSTCVRKVAISLRNPARGSSLANASSSRNPSDPCVWATQKSSVCGGTCPAARSAWIRRLPTCGPFPWTTTSSYPRASTGSRRRTASRARSSWSRVVPESPGRRRALPPNATTASGRTKEKKGVVMTGERPKPELGGLGSYVFPDEGHRHAAGTAARTGKLVGGEEDDALTGGEIRSLSRK